MKEFLEIYLRLAKNLEMVERLIFYHEYIAVVVFSNIFATGYRRHILELKKKLAFLVFPAKIAEE